MKKVDLIKLIEKIADDGDINEIILGADEFKELNKVDLSKLTIEEFKTLIEKNEAIKGYMTSHDDSVRSKAVETFQNGKIKDIIKKAVDEAKNGKKFRNKKHLKNFKSNLKIAKLN